jgi:hypothetical protein
MGWERPNGISTGGVDIGWLRERLCRHRDELLLVLSLAWRKLDISFECRITGAFLAAMFWICLVGELTKVGERVEVVIHLEQRG